MAFLQSFDIIVHPRCTHVIDELRLYSYKRDPLTDEVLPVPRTSTTTPSTLCATPAKGRAGLNPTRKRMYPSTSPVPVPSKHG